MAWTAYGNPMKTSMKRPKAEPKWIRYEAQSWLVLALRLTPLAELAHRRLADLCWSGEAAQAGRRPKDRLPLPRPAAPMGWGARRAATSRLANRRRSTEPSRRTRRPGAKHANFNAMGNAGRQQPEPPAGVATGPRPKALGRHRKNASVTDYVTEYLTESVTDAHDSAMSQAVQYSTVQYNRQYTSKR